MAPVTGTREPSASQPEELPVQSPTASQGNLSEDDATDQSPQNFLPEILGAKFSALILTRLLMLRPEELQP